MVKDIIFTIDTKSGKVKTSRDVLGAVGENLQGDFIIDFDGEFIDGAGVLEMKCGADTGSIPLTKTEKRYTAPIKSYCLQKAGEEFFQVKITLDAEEVPVYKSEPFKLTVSESINANADVPEKYPSWVEETEKRLAELEKDGGGGVSQEYVDDNFVKQTQIAEQQGDYGLVKLGNTNLGIAIYQGQLTLTTGGASYIDGQVYARIAITPANMAYAIKQSLINPNKSVSLPANWTDEERAMARATLGIYKHSFTLVCKFELEDTETLEYNGFFYALTKDLLLTKQGDAGFIIEATNIDKVVSDIIYENDSGLKKMTLMPEGFYVGEFGSLYVVEINETV